MSRVFNIQFEYNGRTYGALVSIMNRDEMPVNVTTTAGSIQFSLPHGVLSLSIDELMKQAHTRATEENDHGIMAITEHISLQILNAEL